VTAANLAPHEDEAPMSAMGTALLAATFLFVAPWTILYLFAEKGRVGQAVLLGAATCTGLVAVPLIVQGDAITGRAAVAVSLGLFFAWLDARRDAAHRSVLAFLPTAQLMSIAVQLAVMDQRPDLFSRIWLLCRSGATLERAQWMLVGSILAYELGRMLVLNRTSKRWREAVANELRSAGSSTRATDAVSLVGIAIFLAIIAIRGAGYIVATALPLSVSGVLGTLEPFYYIGLYAAVASALRTGRRRPAVIAWTLATLAYEVLSGSKGRFALFVLLPLAVIYLLHVRRPNVAAGTTLIGLGLVSWLVVYPVLVVYRGDLSAQGGLADDRVEMLSDAQSRADLDYQDKILVPFLESNLAEQVTAIASIIEFDVRRSPEHLPQRLFLFWIPRAVWSEKPTMLDANEIGRESMRLNDHDRATSVVMTAPGELYVYLGEWGFWMMVLMGIAVGFLAPLPRRTQHATALEIGLVAYLARMLPGPVSGGFQHGLTGFLIQAVVLALLLGSLRFVAPRERDPAMGTRKRLARSARGKA